MSQRVLIVGVSESGKSTLARRLVSGAGLPYFVFDPLGSEWEGAQLVTADFNQLTAAVMAFKQPCIVIVDEAGDAFGVGDRPNHWLFTRGRHSAILPMALAQRMTMIAPNVRDNATDLYLFRSSVNDCKVLADSYSEPGLLAAADLEQGEFLHSRWENGKKCLTRHKLW